MTASAGQVRFASEPRSKRPSSFWAGGLVVTDRAVVTVSGWVRIAAVGCRREYERARCGSRREKLPRVEPAGRVRWRVGMPRVGAGWSRTIDRSRRGSPVLASSTPPPLPMDASGSSTHQSKSPDLLGKLHRPAPRPRDSASSRRDSAGRQTGRQCVRVVLVCRLLNTFLNFEFRFVV